MRYENIITAVFLRRPNRFLAYALADGREVVCHVKNTGRLKELLIPGCTVLLKHHLNAADTGRKTEYSLIGVYKKDALGRGQEILINIDSQAPNRIAEEWLSQAAAGGSFPGGITRLRREVTYGSSRFDLAFTHGKTPAFMEVKGVTLERNGIAMFPDAPTERGVKHLRELARAVKEGYEAYVLFVIQMRGVTAFTPNRETHAEFAEALREAQEAGVKVLARGCDVQLSESFCEGKIKKELEAAITYGINVVV